MNVIWIVADTRELHRYLVKFLRDTNVAPHLIESRLELRL